jgi:membrane protease YdiL (CAAX protease family)
VRILINWFRVLWTLDDDRLLKLVGMDYTMYLIFLRHSSLLFFGLTVFASIFLVPIYGSGTYNQLNHSMDQFTIKNIKDQQNKLVFAYFVALLGVPLTAASVLYQYSKLYASWDGP